MPIWYYDNDVEKIRIPNSIFLAGPTLRFDMRTPWRMSAVSLMGEYIKTRNILIPEFKDGLFSEHAEERFSENYPPVAWEFTAIMKSSVVVYWMPFDKYEFQGLTTRSEVAADLREKILFNECIRSEADCMTTRKLVLGMPKDTHSSSYIRHHARLAQVPIYATLEETVSAALKFDHL